jgi:hypothetical protein
MKHQELSALKMGPSADDLTGFAQPAGIILAGRQPTRHKGCNYRGKPPHKSYQMKLVGPTLWRQQLRNISVHFRKILTIVVITVIIVVMMPVVIEMAD